jgi:hypothetical protein
MTTTSLDSKTTKTSMKRACLLLLYVSCCTNLRAVGLLTTYTTTYQSYNPATGNFDLTESVLYQLPNPNRFGPGPYPVFIYAPGTYEPYNSPLAMEFVSQMTARGFLSASPAYDNTESIQNCEVYTERAQGIYDATRPTSAVGVLCSLSHANCGKGMVTSGVSQGGFMAVLARNYAPNVKAVYALSMSDYAQNIGESFAACVDKSVTAIPANRLTIVNGVSDTIFGGQQPMENVSGYTCPSGSVQCWSPDGNGAGWYNVQNWEVKDGLAGHCYFMVTNSEVNCAGFGDPGWLPSATNNWSLKTNLDWLATLGTQRVFSSTGY